MKPYKEFGYSIIIKKISRSVFKDGIKVLGEPNWSLGNPSNILKNKLKNNKKI